MPSPKAEEILRMLAVAEGRFVPRIEDASLRERVVTDFSDIRDKVLNVLGATDELAAMAHRLAVATAHYCASGQFQRVRQAALDRAERAVRLRIQSLTQGDNVFED